MKVKKEYIESVKVTLKCYPLIESRIKYINDMLSDLKKNSGMFGISYENTRVSSSNVISLTERTALNNWDKEKYYMMELEACHRKIQIIEGAIDQLNPNMSKILKYRYVKLYPWSKIVDEMYISERCGRSKVGEGLKALAVIFYGEKVLVRKEHIS